jgi:thioester reductase-like protein
VVGSRLAADLPRRGDARIVCLVRAEGDAAILRLTRAVLARDPGLTDALIAARRRVPAADMAQPLVGLFPDKRDALARKIGDEFHLVAAINHITPFGVLRGSNALGALEILKFAVDCRVKRVRFASSIAV